MSDHRRHEWKWVRSAVGYPNISYFPESEYAIDDFWECELCGQSTSVARDPSEFARAPTYLDDYPDHVKFSVIKCETMTTIIVKEVLES